MTKNKNRKEHIKSLLKAYTDDIPTPDTDVALNKLKKRFKRRKQYSLATAILIGFLLFNIFYPGTMQAVSEFIKNSLNIRIGDTLELHQRDHMDVESFSIIEHEETERYFTDLINLQNEKITGFFIPDDHFKDAFVYAGIVEKENDVISVTIEFYFDQKYQFLLQQFNLGLFTSYGRTIDIEDYEVKNITVHNKNINVFSHKSGKNTLEWEDNNKMFVVYSELELEKILEYINELGLFN